jgi:hypothetical protein
MEFVRDYEPGTEKQEEEGVLIAPLVQIGAIDLIAFSGVETPGRLSAKG